MITGHEDRKLRFWDLRQKNVIKTIFAHSDSVSSVAFYFSKSNYVFHSGGHDGSLRCWDLRNYSLITENQVNKIFKLTIIYNISLV
jgi:WD40 repeat protein